jgi:sec-independent protein translocase protein TatA
MSLSSIRKTRKRPKGKEKDQPQRRVILMGLGFWELIIILAVIFFIFGGRKIPEISRGIGLSVRNFKKGLHEPDAIDITPKEKGPASEEETPPKSS